MNEAGEQYEWAVRFANFLDGVERISGSASVIILIFTIGYLAAIWISKGWR